MGLENGFILEKLNPEINRFDYLLDKLCEDDIYGSLIKYGHLEIVYWRKHWDWRGITLSYLNNTLNEEQYPYECEYEVNTEQLDKIIKDLTPYLDKDYWNTNSHSIWEYNPKSLSNNLAVLTVVSTILNLFPNEYKLTFYDSY